MDQDGSNLLRFGKVASMHLWSLGMVEMCIARIFKKKRAKMENLTHITTLVGGLEHCLFSHILGIIIPTDELIFLFDEVNQL